jgi:hypothetical protein
MASNLKNTIFERFYSIFDKVQDANKNVENKGTLERYNEVVGEDADDFVYPAIDGAFENLIIPRTMLDKYIVDRENSLGNNVLFLDFTPTMRKRILSHWHRYVNIKGTIRGYEVLFNMLGISITITEIWDTGGFDSATTFDSDSRPTFDSGKCKSCSAYEIDLVGPPITSTIYAAILSIILFNEPINADLTGLTYNGVNLLNIVYNFSYETELIGTHTPIFANTGPTLFFNLASGDPSGYIISNTPSWVYTNFGVKLVEVFVQDFTQVSKIDMTGQQLVNVLDISLFVGLSEFIFIGCPNLLAISFPSTLVYTDVMRVVNTLCSVLDFSGIENMGGSIEITGTNLGTLTLWGGGKSANNTTDLKITNTSLTAIDLEALLFTATTLIEISNNAALISITGGTTIQSVGQIDFMNFANNPDIQLIEIDAVQNAIIQFDMSDCPSLASAVFAFAVWGDRPSETIFFGKNTPLLNIVLDLSTMPIGGGFNMENSAIISVLHSASISPIQLYSIKSCPNIVVYDLKPCKGILGANNSVFDASDCGMIPSTVDAFLLDLVKICVTIRGEIPPGTYSGRVVNIGGTNAAPTGAGLALIAQLNAIGITVNHT